MLLGWILISIPAVALIVAWSKTLRRWHERPFSLAGILCLIFASASELLVFGALVRSEIAGPFASQNFRIEGLGLGLSLSGVVAGLAVRHKNQHRQFGLGLGAAGWLFFLFFVVASSQG
jgi:hypothetical protein